MANKTDIALVAKGAQTRKQTDRLVIGLLDDQTAVVGMQGDNEVFRINTAFMQPNHYNGDTSLQVFACAKGGRDVEIDLFDEDGNSTGNEIGWFKINCKINNSHLVETIAADNDIDIKPKK